MEQFLFLMDVNFYKRFNEAVLKDQKIRHR